MTNQRVLPIILLLISGCANQRDTQSTPLIVNDSLKSAYSEFGSEMRKERTQLEFESGETVSNCGQYFAKKSAQSLAESTDNFLAQQDYVICNSLKVVRESAENISLIMNQKPGTELGARLDLRSFRSSLFQRTTEESRTPASVFNQDIITKTYSIQPTIQDWRYVVEVVAIVDSDGNGESDWLVWVTDKSGTGSYDTLQAYLAYNVQQEGLIELTAL